MREHTYTHIKRMNLKNPLFTNFYLWEYSEVTDFSVMQQFVKRHHAQNTVKHTDWPEFYKVCLQ